MVSSLLMGLALVMDNSTSVHPASTSNVSEPLTSSSWGRYFEEHEDVQVRFRDELSPAKLFLPMRLEGHDMDAFVTRLGPVFRHYTAHTGYELCGMICRNADSLSLQPLTVESHIACPITSQCAEGFESTGIHVHSHHPEGHYRLNAADRHFGGPSSERIHRRGDEDRFSDADLRSGAGYLITTRQVLFHDGERRVHEVTP